MPADRCADHHRGQIHDDPFGLVVAKDGDHIAGLHAKRNKRASGLPDFIAVGVPGRRRPPGVAPDIIGRGVSPPRRRAAESAAAAIRKSFR